MWIAHRGDRAAARELLDAAREADLDGLQTAYWALQSVAADAEPEVRAALDDPVLGPIAMGWLVAQHGEQFQPEVRAGNEVATFIATCAMVLLAGGEGDIEVAARVEPAEQEQFAGFVRELWRTDSPYTAMVLEALGAHHPVKAVRRAAKQALFRLRNR